MQKPSANVDYNLLAVPVAPYRQTESTSERNRITYWSVWIVQVDSQVTQLAIARAGV